MLTEEISLLVTNQGSRAELREALDIADRKGIKPIYKVCHHMLNAQERSLTLIN